MGKLGISLPDDVKQKLDAMARDKGKTVSGLIADALLAYFSQDEKPPIPSAPSSPTPPTSSTDLQYVLCQIRDLAAKVNDNTATTNEILKTASDLDERLSKLWHQVNDG